MAKAVAINTGLECVDPTRRPLVECGVHILGTGPHRTQGVEIIEGRPIIYASGDLLVDFGGELVLDEGSDLLTEDLVFFLEGLEGGRHECLALRK